MNLNNRIKRLFRSNPRFRSKAQTLLPNQPSFIKSNKEEEQTALHTGSHPSNLVIDTSAFSTFEQSQVKEISPSAIKQTHQSKQRIVRIYVASTFRDMASERDLLAKRVFPELRNRCRTRQIELLEVDLRWGITEEQSERGETVPICLAEIDNCRPYFLCFLGERYGWIPSSDSIPSTVFETYPWLKEKTDKSITELEILYGVLNNPTRDNHAIFYLRDPMYVKKVPKSICADYLPESKKAAKKLADLKRRIRASRSRIFEGYTDPETACSLVLEELWSRIDTSFPISELIPLSPEVLDQEAFALSRTAIYVGRNNIEQTIENHLATTLQPLILTGVSGVGKSSILASWTMRRQIRYPKSFYFLHFIGATPQSADYIYLLKRLYSEIKQFTQIEDEIPVQSSQLVGQLSFWLESLSIYVQSHEVEAFLVLDALDQLDDRDDAPLLGWFPEKIPSGVRLIMSTLPGSSYDVTRTRGYGEIFVAPLGKEECQTLIIEYLHFFRRSLSQQRIDRIVKSPQAANPLFLRILLNELRLSASHETLDTQISHYLNAPDPKALYDLMLQRLEKECDGDYTDLTKTAFSYIWAARKGVTEIELLELLRRPGEKILPRVLWSPLYLAMEDALITRSGLLNFFHNYLREAVRARYLPNEQAISSQHMKMGNYFKTSTNEHRRVEELPWHLLYSHQFDALANYLTDGKAFLMLTKSTLIHDLLYYWLSLVEHVNFTSIMSQMLDTIVREGDTSQEIIFDQSLELAYLLGDREAERQFLDIWQLRSDSNKVIIGKLLLRKAHLAHRMHHHSDAVLFVTEAAERAISPKLRLEALLMKLQYLAFGGKYSDAIALASYLEREFMRVLHADIKYDAWYHHKASFVFHETDDNASFARYNKICQDFYLESNDRYNYCIATVNYGDGLWGIGAIEEARHELESGKQRADQWNIAHAKDIANICLANLYASIGNTGEALDLYNEGIKLAQEIGHEWDELYGLIYRTLAEAEYKQEDKSGELIELSNQASEIGEQYLRDIALAYASVVSLYTGSSKKTLAICNRICLNAVVPSAIVYGASLSLALQPQLSQTHDFYISLYKYLPHMTGLKGRPGVPYHAIEWLKTHGYLEPRILEIFELWKKSFVSTDLISVNLDCYKQSFDIFRS